MSTRQMQAELRRMGFTLEFRTRSGGMYTTRYNKQIDENRKVEVDFNEIGKHTATHWYRGCMSTYPSEFDDMYSMRSAVQRETERKDNNYYPRFKVTVEKLSASNGVTYVLCMGHMDDVREVSLQIFQGAGYEVRNYTQRYQAEYERACLERWINKRWSDPEPDILTFNEETYPNE